MPSVAADLLEKKPRVALMQPTFLPWLGYFALIRDADIFMFLDDFQFVRRSFGHRNRLCDKNGQEVMVSLPITHAGSQDVNYNEATPLFDLSFKKKLMGNLLHCYGKSRFYKEILPLVEDWACKDYMSLAEVNMTFIKGISAYLGFDTEKFVISSGHSQKGQRSERILSLLESVGAKTYLCARGARDYMEEDKLFPVNHCDVAFQTYAPAEYPQNSGQPFVPYMSIIDALMHLGRDGTLVNIDAGTKPYEIWHK